MAWITPVTDRINGARMTVTDMNRICGNIDYLTTELTAHSLYSGPTLSKTTYTYNDYVTLAEWTEIIRVLSTLVAQTAVETEQADMSTTYQNMNAVESMTLAVYDLYQMLLSQTNANYYAGDDIYAQGNISLYAGGLTI